MGKLKPSDDHRKLCGEYAARLIPLIRDRAKELGYAIGVHGSLQRDIDLIAAPWTDEAVPAIELAQAVQKVAEKEIGFAFALPHEDSTYFRMGQPGNKSMGRLCWSFHLGGGPYIDISIMPTLTKEEENVRFQAACRLINAPAAGPLGGGASEDSPHI